LAQLNSEEVQKIPKTNWCHNSHWKFAENHVFCQNHCNCNVV